MADAIVSSTIRLSNPSNDLKEWAKANLNIANPDYVKKQRMGFSVWKTPKMLCLYEENGLDYILPYGCLDELTEHGVNITSQYSPTVRVDYKCKVPLYIYQEKAKLMLWAKKHGILQAPAGSGKTQIGIALIASLGKRALWITHTKDLLNQSKERAERYMSSELIGTITEGKVSIGSGVTFATVQTLCRLDLTRYRDTWNVIIVDECHRVAGTPTAMTMFSKVLNSLNAEHKYGLSATVHRADGLIKATYSLLGRVVYEIPKTEVADKVMRVGIKAVETGTKISTRCINTDGTLNYTALISYLSDDEERNRLILEHIREEHAAGHSILVLSLRLSQLEWFKDHLGDDAQMIDGTMVSKKEKAKRESAIEDMRKGRCRILLASYNLAKEGLDIPILDRLILAAPQKDYAVITQSIGRIARTAPDKQDPICLDFVDDIQYLIRMYKKRVSVYRKNDCYFITE